MPPYPADPTSNRHAQKDHMCRAFSGRHRIACVQAGTCPNIHLGAINRAPGDTMFPLKRMMSYWEFHTGKLSGHINLHFKRYIVSP